MARPRFACLMLVLVTLLLYLPSQHFEYLEYDDPLYVQSNPIVQAGLTWDGLQWAFSGAHASNWHPLTWLSHMLDCELFGPDPGAAHLVNAMFHAANGALVFLLLSRIFGAFWPALFGAALFAWHPLRVESVAWVAERKDVLSAFFALLTLLSYLRYGRERQRRDYWLTLVYFALGLLAKPMLVTLPFLLLLLDYWPLQRWKTTQPQRTTLTAIVVEKLPFLALALASCAVTFWAQQAEAVVPLEMISVKLRLANALVAYMTYLGKIFWPVNLCPFYPFNLWLGWGEVVWAGAGLGLLTGLIWWAGRTRPYLRVGWLWFLGTLVPVIGLIQVGSQALADRYTYIPMIGILIALTGGLMDILSRWRINPKAPAAVGVVLLAGCLLASHRQLMYWRDTLTLFSHALVVTQNNAMANVNVGIALEHRGDKSAALQYYREALRISPGISVVHNNMASVLQSLGQMPEAEEHYQTALQLKPGNGMTHCNYGVLLVQVGRYDEAMGHFATAAKLRPWDPYPYYLMGKTRMRQGRGAEAVLHFRQALKIYPKHSRTLTLLARLLATSTDPEIRNGREAIPMAEFANEQTSGLQAFVLDTLAAAYAEGGRFDDAEKALEAAIKISTAAGENDVVADMQQRLKLYQSHQAYRESPDKTILETEPAPETVK